jgi:PAS domain S-box-containing protein
VAERLWAALQQVHAEAASRAADAHARQHLRELEAVYASAPVGLCLIDRELRYVRINERLAEMNGVSAAAHLGRTVREMVPGLADVAEPAFRHVMATGEPVIDVELRGETPAAPGVERVWLESWYPMRNAEGNIVGVNVSALEVTERTRAEEALRDADRRKSDFLAILAHELRTPLAPIRTALSILQTKGIDDPACASAIGVLERQVTQMVRLIDDLLDVSRIGRGKLELRKERIDLASVVTGAAEAAQPTCASKRHTLQVAMPPEPIRVHADPARLLQVLANLLNNACKFTLPGGRIDLSLAREGEQVLIRVRDNGIGIAAEELPNVFNLFAQAPEALERAAAGGAGLGIGLALARTLVQMHGGELCAQSAGRWLGSEFVVRLPLEHEPTDLDAPPASTASGQATARRILVVDDHQDAVESLAMLLEISGHTAYTARDGEEALRTAEKTRPDVVLLDLDLPLIDGYEVCRRLRAHPWGKDALLVAVSGWAREKDRTRAREAGFDAHLAKPLELDQLLAFLASAPLDRAASSSLVGLPKRTGK